MNSLKLSANCSHTKWTCRKCLHDGNPIHISLCQECNSARFPWLLPNQKTKVEGKDDEASTPKEYQFWICPKCGEFNLHDEKTCRVCLAPQDNSTTLPENKKITENENGRNGTPWECTVCNHQNYRTTVICDMCFTITGCANEKPKRLSQDKRVDLSWKYAVSRCKLTNQSFVDEDFPAEYGSLYYSPEDHEADDTQWLRLCNVKLHGCQNNSPWVLFRYPLKPTDVVQGIFCLLVFCFVMHNFLWVLGAAGNCWLISALSVLALQHEHIIRRLFITFQVCEEGAYQIRLCKDGKWTSIMVDDRVPCDRDGYPYYAEALENQMWVPLIEKAVAKLYGCYETLVAGHLTEGLNMLTGVACTSISVYLSDNNRNESNLNTIWSKLLEYRNKRYPMLASCGSNYIDMNNEEAEEKGLETLHCYCVLDVREIRERRLIKLLDSRGETDWKCELTKADILDLYMGSELLLNGSGDLWINLEDLTKYFSAVGVCKLRNEWFEETMSGKYPTYEDQTPSFISFVVEEMTEIEFVLYQKNLRVLPETERYQMDLFLVILKRNEKCSYELFDYTEYRSTNLFICHEKTFERGKYVVIPLSFNHWHSSHFKEPKYASSFNFVHLGILSLIIIVFRFNLAFHSSKQIITRQIQLTLTLRDILIPLARKYGEPQDCLPELRLYYLKKSFLGALMMVENRYDAWAHFKCIAKESCCNITSSRGNTLNTVDSIPPQHGQIVAIYTKLKYENMKSQYVFDHRMYYRIVCYPELYDWGDKKNSLNVPKIKKDVDILHQAFAL
ncbi:hypothetical protein ILUMI_04794, partial [Ignelater luminosus]